MSLKELLSGRVRIGLQSVKYDFIGDVQQENSDVVVFDKASVAGIFEDHVKVVVTRKVVFYPKNMFDLEVAYYVNHYFEDEHAGSFDMTIEQMDEEIAMDIDYFTEMEQGKASLLIAEITGFAGSPLITPPVFIEQEDK